MTSIKVSAKAFPERVRELERRFPKAVERGMREASLMLRGALVQIAIKKADPQPVDQGQYKAGWGGRDVPGGAHVFNLTKQAFFIERGRRKGKMPPHAPIREWVRRKGLWKDRFAELKTEAAEAQRRARHVAKVDRQRAAAARKYGMALLGRKAWLAAEKRNNAAFHGPKPRRGFRRKPQLQPLKHTGKRSLPSFQATFDRKTDHLRAGRRFTMKDQAINEVAMLVRRKIARRGTPEKRVLRNAIRALKPKMPGILRRALREIRP